VNRIGTADPTEAGSDHSEDFEGDSILMNHSRFFAFLAIAFSAWAQPTATIGSSPSAAVRITPVDPSDPRIPAGLFGGNRAALLPISFFLGNQSSQAIVGLSLVYTVTDHGGRKRTARVASDSFLTPAVLPVVKPGEEVLVTRGVRLAPVSSLSLLAQNALPSMQRAADEYWAMSEIRVEIDSVIFADGETAGRDQAHYAKEIVARKQAADSVVAAIDVASANGSGVEGTLNKMASQPVNLSKDPFHYWQRMFAHDALLHATFADHFLRRMPAAPLLPAVKL
jgi:hypothetical protein